MLSRRSSIFFFSTQMYFLSFSLLKTIVAFLTKKSWQSNWSGYWAMLFTYQRKTAFSASCLHPWSRYPWSSLLQLLAVSLFSELSAEIFFFHDSKSVRGLVCIKGRRPVGVENEGYDTDDDSDDEGNVRSMPEETKVSCMDCCSRLSILLASISHGI